MAYFLLENGSHLQLEDHSGWLLLEFSLVVPTLTVRPIMDIFAGPQEMITLNIDVYSGPSIVAKQRVDSFGSPCVIKVN